MTDHAIDFGPDTERVQLAPGDILCREGDEAHAVYQVMSGALDVLRATAEGELLVARVEEGSIVGEVTYAVGGTRTATLRASTESEIAVIPHDDFIVWQGENPEQAAQLAARARRRLNETRAAGVLTNLLGMDHHELISSIVGRVVWRTLPAGETLFLQGDEADAAYVIVAGRLQIIASDDEGKVVLDKEIGRGELVGEIGIIENSPRSASAIAIRETTVASISRELFEHFTTRHPNLMLKIFRTILHRLMREHVPDNRARVVTVAVTASDPPADLLSTFVDAVAPFGSTLHLSKDNLGDFVRDLNGTGASTRVAEFLHEADVAHDYVVLETDEDLTSWSVSAARQSDRFVLFTSPDPGPEEENRIRAFLGELNPRQRASAWIARLHPAHVDHPRRSAHINDHYNVGEVHNVRVDRPSHVRRVARLATGNGRGVILGGGGARGIGHIGALRALKESGLEYDRIAGASMGSVIAASAARDYDQDTMERLAAEHLVDLLDITVPLVSLFKAEKITVGMNANFEGWDIADLWLPYYCVTTNLTTAELAVHRRGPIVRAMRASVAIPAVFPPVPIDGELHVDGGVLDNIPVTPMSLDNSIGTVIAIDVSPTGGPSAERDYGEFVSGFDVLKRKVSRNQGPAFPDLGQTLMSSLLIGASQAKQSAESEGLVDLHLQLDLSDFGLLKFERHDELFAKGYEDAKPAIEEWLAAQDRPR